MKPHRELLCRSGRKTKADRSERRYNQPWVLRKKHFAASFQCSFYLLSSQYTIHHHPPPCVELVMLAQTDPVQGLNRQNSRRCSVRTHSTNSAHVEAALRCRVQLKPEGLRLGVCYECVYVCVGVIEKHGFPQRDPPLIVKWRSLRATPGTSIKHRQATDNLSLSPHFLFLSPLIPSLIYPLKFKFTFKFKQGSLPWKEQP